MPKARETMIGLRNILLGGGLSSVRTWRRPREWAVWSTEILAIWDALLDSKGIPLRSVAEVFPTNGPVTVTLWDPPMGPLASRTVDMLALCELCAILKAETVFEIGTLHGQTALHFAMNGAKRVLSLDLPPGDRTASLATTTSDEDIKEDHARTKEFDFEDTQWEDCVTCLHGDSALFDYAPYFGKVDLFFIDGAHSYEYVRSDTLKALACIKPGGTIAWHDFGRRGVNGVSRWLRQLSVHVPVYALPGGSLAFGQVKSPSEVLKALEAQTAP